MRHMLGGLIIMAILVGLGSAIIGVFIGVFGIVVSINNTYGELPAIVAGLVLFWLVLSVTLWMPDR